MTFIITVSPKWCGIQGEMKFTCTIAWGIPPQSFSMSCHWTINCN